MAELGKLSYSKAEWKFVCETDRGKECDLRSGKKRPHQVLRSEVFVRQCLKERLGQVQVRGARIRGKLDLRRANLANSLRLSDCIVEDDIVLDEMRAAEPIEFTECELGTLHADRMECAKHFVLKDSKLSGSLFLAEVKIADDLRLSGTRIETAISGTAVHAPEMRVDGTVFLNQTFSAKGTVYLGSSHIGVDLDCTGAFFEAEEKALNATHTMVGSDFILERVRSRGEVCVQWSHVETFGAAGAELSNKEGYALRADTLRARSGVYLDREFHAMGKVHLVGAEIKGELCCTGGTFENLKGTALDATRVNADSVYLDRGFTARGEVRLTGAKITRQLCCTGGRFDNEGGYALDADGLICDGDVFLNSTVCEEDDPSFVAHGEVRLLGAEIGRGLNCTGGTFKNGKRRAINADGLTTRGDVFFDEGFWSQGTVHLARATVGRQLRCTAGVFDNAFGSALDLSGLVGSGDVLLNGGFQAIGDVQLLEADIGRDLDLTAGEFKGNLKARNVNVGAALILKMEKPPEGALDLSFSSVQRLCDNMVSWPEGGTYITGFVYRTIEDDVGVEGRLAWLDKMKEYSLESYLQLSSNYANSGNDEWSRKVGIAGYRAQRKRGGLPRRSRFWNRLLDVLVRSGYQLMRPIWIYLLLGLVNIVIYSIALHFRIMEAVGLPESMQKNPTIHNRCPGHFPCFNPVLYAYESITPFVNLRQLNYWLPDTESNWGVALMIYLFLSIIFGWVLGIAFTAGVSRAIKR